VTARAAGNTLAYSHRAPLREIGTLMQREDEHEHEHDQVEITSTLTDSSLMLHLRGPLDLRTAHQARPLLVQAVDALPPPALLVLDLRDLSHLAAIGVGILTGLADRCAQKGVTTHLVADPDSTIYRVLQIAEHTHRIPIFATLELALSTSP
jgi:anti-anti-sigma factor